MQESLTPRQEAPEIANKYVLEAVRDLGGSRIVPFSHKRIHVPTKEMAVDDQLPFPVVLISPALVSVPRSYTYGILYNAEYINYALDTVGDDFEFRALVIDTKDRYRIFKNEFKRFYF